MSSAGRAHDVHHRLVDGSAVAAAAAAAAKRSASAAARQAPRGQQQRHAAAAQRDDEDGDDNDNDEDEDEEDDDDDGDEYEADVAGSDDDGEVIKPAPRPANSSNEPRRWGRGKYLKPKPLKEVLTRVITALLRRDIYAFFSEPVKVDEVPGYTAVVKEPLDLGTIQERVIDDRYLNVSAFEADVDLVFRNAMAFNPKDSIYYSEAERLATWFRKKIELEAPSAILPDPADACATKGNGGDRGKTDGKPRVRAEEANDADEAEDDNESGDDNGTYGRGLSVTRTASPEAFRSAAKRRRLNTGDDGVQQRSLASLLSANLNAIGLPGPNTPIAKAVASAATIQARWRLSAAAASLCAYREARQPARATADTLVLKPLLERSKEASSQVASDSPGAKPVNAPLPIPGDDAIAPANPLSGLRKLQYHPDGSVKIPGFTTAAQGWPDTAEAFAMELLPESTELHRQLGRPAPPPRIRGLFPLLPLPAPSDAVAAASGKTLPVPLSVGGTSALSSNANLASVTFAAAQQTPWTSSGNPFPNVRPDDAVLKTASTTAALLAHPVPLNATFSHEVAMQTPGGQTTFGPGQGPDGGPWTVASGGPDHDPESTVLETPPAEAGEGSGSASWWDTESRKRSALPSHWALPGLIPFSSAVPASSMNGTRSPTSPSTPSRPHPGTPTAHDASTPGPSTPAGANTSSGALTSAQGWAQRASKGREKERERESDLRDWTITRPVLERALAFEDVGTVWAEVRARMSAVAGAMLVRSLNEARRQISELGAQMTAAQAGGRMIEAQQCGAQLQAQRRLILDKSKLAAFVGEAEQHARVEEGRYLGRYDFVEGEHLDRLLEHALSTEVAEKLWHRTQHARNSERLPFSSVQEVQAVVTNVQQGVFGGPLGDSYAQSVARFVRGAQKSVHEWSDVSRAIEAEQRAAEREAAAMREEEEVNAQEAANAMPRRRRDYHEDEYIGGRLRALLQPPKEEDDEAGPDSRRDADMSTSSDEPSNVEAVKANGHAQGPDVATAAGTDNGRIKSPEQASQRPTIKRDDRPLEDIVRADILDPLTGGLLSVLHFAGVAVRETEEVLRAPGEALPVSGLA